MAITWALAVAARGDSTTAPTWEQLAEQTDSSQRTVCRWLAWLRDRGLLVVLETGSTPETRPATAALVGNRCAVYVLTERVAQEQAEDEQRIAPVYELGDASMCVK